MFNYEGPFNDDLVDLLDYLEYQENKESKWKIVQNYKTNKKKLDQYFSTHFVMFDGKIKVIPE